MVLAESELQAEQGKTYSVADQEEDVAGVAAEETEGRVETEGGVAAEEEKTEGGVEMEGGVATEETETGVTTEKTTSPKKP